MSLNCSHAWEDYQKLDLAHDDLRREYLALREAQTDSSNVPKDWLIRMREFRKKCLVLGNDKKTLLKDFHGIYSSEEFEKIKLKILQNKMTENKELTQRDLRFLYSIDSWPSDETEIILNEMIEKRNKRKDLAKALNCSEEQISFSQEEFEKGKDIIYHWGGLYYDKFTDYYDHNGNIIYYNSSIYDGFSKFPKYIRGKLALNGPYHVKWIQLPSDLKVRELSFENLTNAAGLKFPDNLQKLYLNNLDERSDNLDLSNCKSIRLIRVSTWNTAMALKDKYPNFKNIIKPMPS